MIALPRFAEAMAYACAFAILAWAWRDLPWYKLRGDREAWRVLIVALAAAIALRWFNTDAIAGVDLHFLGATAATVMFGARFALWATATVSFVATVAGHAWYGWAADFLATGAVPVAISAAIGRYLEPRLPRNPVMFVLVRAFFAGALAIAASHLLKAAVVRAFAPEAAAAMPVADRAVAYLAATPPMMFGEGFLCGGAIALIVVYRPQWCASFDDSVHLRRTRDD